MGFKWPSTIEERPIFTHVVGKTVHFSDGTTAEIDAIMFCTGKLKLVHVLLYDIFMSYLGIIWDENIVYFFN